MQKTFRVGCSARSNSGQRCTELNTAREAQTRILGIKETTHNASASENMRDMRAFFFFLFIYISLSLFRISIASRFKDEEKQTKNKKAIDELRASEFLEQSA